MRTSIFENPSFSYTPLTQSPKETRPRSSKAILGNVLNQAPPDYVLLELDPHKGHSLQYFHFRSASSPLLFFCCC